MSETIYFKSDKYEIYNMKLYFPSTIWMSKNYYLDDE